jgi:hypothetical protein
MRYVYLSPGLSFGGFFKKNVDNPEFLDTTIEGFFLGNLVLQLSRHKQRFPRNRRSGEIDFKTG